MAVHGIVSPGFIAPYASGSIFMPDGMDRVATGAAAAAGLVRLTPGKLRRGVTITDLFARISTNAASGNFQLSVYASDPASNMPTGAPVYTSSSQSTGTATLMDIGSVGLTVGAGLYWWGVQVDTNGAAAVFVGIDGNLRGLMGEAGNPSQTGLLNVSSQAVGLTKSGSFGTWPTLTGNFTNDGLTIATTATCPAVAFKAQ